jgi:U3 small nucleolar RNA-associated protein 14
MPGWGGWAGAGIDMNAIKKKQQYRNRYQRNGKRYRKPLFIRPEDVIKTEEEKKLLIRRDKDLTHVIISEKKDAKIASFQVSFLMKITDFSSINFF